MFLLEVFFFYSFSPHSWSRFHWELPEFYRKLGRKDLEPPWTWVETKPYCWGGETTTATLRTSIMMCWCVDSHWCAGSYLHTTCFAPRSCARQALTVCAETTEFRWTAQDAGLGCGRSETHSTKGILQMPCTLVSWQDTSWGKSCSSLAGSHARIGPSIFWSQSGSMF